MTDQPCITLLTRILITSTIADVLFMIFLGWKKYLINKKTKCKQQLNQILLTNYKLYFILTKQLIYTTT